MAALFPAAFFSLRTQQVFVERLAHKTRTRKPATGQPVTGNELFQFARDHLRLNYIFRGTREPHYANQIFPFLHGLARSEGR